MRLRRCARCILALLLGMLVLFSRQSPANAARREISPVGNVAPIQMVALEVNLVLLRVKAESSDSSATASVRARAVLRRAEGGDAPVRVVFPLRDPGGRGEQFGRYAPIEFELLGFSVNGRQSKASLLNAEQAAAVDVNFPLDQDVQLDLAYFLRSVNVGPWRVFRYPLHVTAGWAGDVAEARFIVNLPYPASELTVDTAASSPGVSFAGDRAFWRFGPLEPKPEDDFVVAVLSRRAWQRVQEAEVLLRRRASSQRWLNLARTYRDVIVPGERTLRLGEAYVERMIEAYRQAAQTNNQPEVVELELAQTLATLYAPPWPAKIAEVIIAALERALARETTQPAARTLAERLLAQLDQAGSEPDALQQRQELQDLLRRVGGAITPTQAPPEVVLTLTPQPVQTPPAEARPTEPTPSETPQPDATATAEPALVQPSVGDRGPTAQPTADPLGLTPASDTTVSRLVGPALPTGEVDWRVVVLAYVLTGLLVLALMRWWLGSRLS